MRGLGAILIRPEDLASSKICKTKMKKKFDISELGLNPRFGTYTFNYRVMELSSNYKHTPFTVLTLLYKN